MSRGGSRLNVDLNKQGALRLVAEDPPIKILDTYSPFSAYRAAQ